MTAQTSSNNQVSLKQSIQQSARVAELRAAMKLVERRRPVILPHNSKARNARLLALIAAERRRNAALIEVIHDR